MPYIKKLVMQGFKSFAKPTEILFDNGLNTIIGPNGSGKSNVSDAICFVLGRLSIKSIRAAKAANLIYNGGKNNRPAPEARVDLVIDNSDNTFSSAGLGNELIISRIVRRDGQSIYKINEKTKTRQEVLDLLAQGGIDPYGFNIMLQGEISRFVEMHADERRGVIEDIAGISIYEVRKEKSLHELEKTDSKLKEIGTVLQERTAYLRNLDKERSEALKYRELETSIKRDKASIKIKAKRERTAEKSKLEKSISEKKISVEKMQKKLADNKREFDGISSEIEGINRKIQESTGITQETLHREITDSRADMAALSVRVENYRQQLSELNERTSQLEKNIKKEKENIIKLKEKMPKQGKISELLKQKTTSFEEIERKYDDYYKLKTSLTECVTKIDIMKKRGGQLQEKASLIRGRIKGVEGSIEHSEEDLKKMGEFKVKIEKLKERLDELDKKHLRTLQEAPAYMKEIEVIENLRKQLNEIAVCPTCGREVTEEHKDYINKKSKKETGELRKKAEKNDSERNAIEKEIAAAKEEAEKIQQEHEKMHLSKMSIEQLREKKEMLDELENERHFIIEDMSKLEKSREHLEEAIKKQEEIEKRYKKAKEDLGRIGKEDEETSNIHLDLKMKEQDVARMQLIVKNSAKQKEELEENINATETGLGEKKKQLEKKEDQDKKLRSSFNSLFEKRNSLQHQKGQIELEMANQQNDIRRIEDDINVIRIAMAKIDAEIETLEIEIGEFGEVKVVEMPKKELEARIQRNEERLGRIGSVNMRALEVYDSVKSEYDVIAEKVGKLENEKTEIMRIIEEIDKKKENVFMKTLNTINALFSSNFMRLSGKGQVWLELENKDEPFAAGLDILVKIAKGKYMDITSLSGGEQVLVALSLIFAIQEYKPYCFYILDEIDAALDKRNSERLAELLDNYVKAAQYIIISHNDAVISAANTLYGVSMQEGISKIISLKL